MSKKITPARAGKLPSIESTFIEALKAIAKAEHWTLEQLLDDIKAQPGKSLASKARLYAINYYRDHAALRGFAEKSGDPFAVALKAVSKVKK